MTLEITIKGKVQGVNFRDMAKEIADKIKVRGTVENLDNGDVFILAQGKKKILEGFVDWCKIGPENAEVEEVITQRIESNFLKNFIVKRW